jgi:hypothetical protein
VVPAPALGNRGGLLIAQDATLDLDSFTLTNTIDNSADVDPSIDGTSILRPC